MRALSNNFFNDLMNAKGLLHPILEQVKQDHTLMLAIRDKYINIYYRGGNILKVTEQGNVFYQTSFDDQYNKAGKTIPVLPTAIKCQANSKTWVDEFPHLKEIMDIYSPFTQSLSVNFSSWLRVKITALPSQMKLSILFQILNLQFSAWCLV